MKKILLVILVLLLVGGFAFAGSALPDMDGDTYYEISTCLELQDMNLDFDLNYELTANIDCSDTINWNDGNGFIPIGSDINNFNGNFNGNNYGISNLFISTTTIGKVGLFGAVASNLLTNVGLVDVNILAPSTGSWVGALVADTQYNSSCVISNSYSTGNIVGGYIVGGLVGLSDSNIENSYSTVNLQNYPGGNPQYFGGLAGTGNSILNSYATGDINVSNPTSTVVYAGGLAGGASSGTIYRSYATGGIFVTGNLSNSAKVGGLVGDLYNADVNQCYSNNSFVTGKIGVGGLIGLSTVSLISDSYSSSDVNGYAYVGGLIGYFTAEEETSLYNSYSTGDVNASSYVGGLLGVSDVEDTHNSFTTSKITPAEALSGGAVGFLSRGSLENIYWFRHGDANYVSLGGYFFEEGAGDTNCTSVNETDGNTVAYFYESLNEPLAQWDFVNVWVEQDGNYPTLNWAYDSDGDGNNNSDDPLLFNEGEVTQSGLTNDLNILVGGEDTNQLFSGIKEFVFYDGSTKFMDFNHNLTSTNFDLNKVTIEISSTGIVVDLNGQLQSDQNKTLYLSNNSFSSLCVKNAPITSISEISSTCNGANEYDFSTCLTTGSYSTAGISCTLAGGIITVSNLQHSGLLGSVVVATPAATPTYNPTISSGPRCESVWDCDEWSECDINNEQIRTCADTSTCKVHINRPATIQDCNYTPQEIIVPDDNNVPLEPEVSSKIIDTLDGNNPPTQPSTQEDVPVDYTPFTILIIILVLAGIAYYKKEEIRKIIAR